jgi:hypothetical protein
VIGGDVLTLDRTLVQIRERSFLGLLDLALVVVRRRPVTLTLTALAGVAPWAALNAWLVAGDPDLEPLILLGLVALEAPLATAPLCVVLGGLMFGQRPTAGQVLRTLLRNAPALLVYQGLLRGLLVVSVIFSPLIPARLGFLNEVILLERGPWRSAVRRGATLCGDRGGELFGRWLAQCAFGAMFVVAFGVAGASALEMLAGGDLAWEEPEWATLTGPRAQLGVWLAVAFFAVVRFLTYIDQRIRLEGWEVELRLRAVGAAMTEDSERW